MGLHRLPDNTSMQETFSGAPGLEPGWHWSNSFAALDEQDHLAGLTGGEQRRGKVHHERMAAGHDR